MLADAENEEIEKHASKETKTEKPTLEDINSLIAHEKVSDKGPYEIINKAENMNNPAYEKLHAYIANHNSFVALHGHQLWIFSNNSDTIGYRKQ